MSRAHRTPGHVAVTAALGIAACGPSAVDRVLDPDALLGRHVWRDDRDTEWYAAHIPFFESPDSVIDATYYYRWELLRKHLTYGSPEHGYTLTEFIDRPFWSGTYGAISCPLGHQAYDLRWLDDRRIVEDFARYWFETPGAEPRSYSNWYGDAMWATYLVLGDTSFLRAVLPHMESQVAGWVEERWDPGHGMFRWDGMHDGMEFNIDGRQTDRPFDGGDGYRPTLNSYLWADQLAISRAADVLGDTAKARDYAARAAALKDRIQDELWDPEREFFFHQWAADQRGGIEAKSLTHETGPYAGSPHGREEIGFVPWQFGLPDPGYEAAWRFLVDPEYFDAPYGPTTTERNDPLFRVSPRCCEWSGNSWPYATSQTLQALGNLLRDYEQEHVTRADYARLLQRFAATHRKGGRPYLAEAADPDDGSFEGHDTYYHSEHYLHSHFIDLIVTGLAGLRPRDDDTLAVEPLAPEAWPYFALDGVRYRGRRIAIVWDRDGSRYGLGPGFKLLVDGRTVAEAAVPGPLSAPLGSGPAAGAAAWSAPDTAVNVAVNNSGAAFPRVSASYSDPDAPPFYLIDGSRWYHRSPPNGWSSAGSGSPADRIELDFGASRRLDSLSLYFLDDSTAPPIEARASTADGVGPARGDRSPEEVRAPADYMVEMWEEGGWVPVPGEMRRPAIPVGRRANRVVFPPITTRRLRVTLEHRPGAASGLTEIEAWSAAGPPPPVEGVTPPNLALDDGSDGAPRVSASYTFEDDRAEHVNDGRIAFPYYTRNRWTAFGSPNPSDWVEIDFGTPREVREIAVYLWGDEYRGEQSGVAAPRTLRIEVWDGERWSPAEVESRVPERPRTSARNLVRIRPVETPRVRVVVEHDRPAATGISEIEVYGGTR